MFKLIHSIRGTACFRAWVGVVLCAFVLSLPGSASAQPAVSLPAPGMMVNLTTEFTPPLLKGLVVHPENPLHLDFLITPGDADFSPGSRSVKTEEYNKLVKYFLAALTVPEKDLWVNLSPYEKDRMIPQNFGQTEMGRDLLSQDYILKQITASLIYPEKDLGKKFWDRVYRAARARFGTTQIPVNTFNKVWIIPDKAAVYEKDNTVFLVDCHLKVMLEEDYNALEHNRGNKQLGTDRLAQEKVDDVSAVSSQVVREVILPAIEKEVNEGKNFSLLRQITNSLVLAAWYKKALQESLLGRVYVDRSKTTGVHQEDPSENQKIYERYLAAFKKGVYNYIKEDVDPVTRKVVPRKYFSGGYTTADTTGKPVGERIARLDPGIPAHARAIQNAFTQTAADGVEKVAVVLNETREGGEMVINQPVSSGADPAMLADDRPGETPRDFNNEELINLALTNFMESGTSGLAKLRGSLARRGIDYQALADDLTRVAEQRVRANIESTKDKPGPVFVRVGEGKALTAYKIDPRNVLNTPYKDLERFKLIVKMPNLGRELGPNELPPGAELTQLPVALSSGYDIMKNRLGPELTGAIILQKISLRIATPGNPRGEIKEFPYVFAQEEVETYANFITHIKDNLKAYGDDPQVAKYLRDEVARFRDEFAQLRRKMAERGVFDTDVSNTSNNYGRLVTGNRRVVVVDMDQLVHGEEALQSIQEIIEDFADVDKSAQTAFAKTGDVDETELFKIGMRDMVNFYTSDDSLFEYNPDDFKVLLGEPYKNVMHKIWVRYLEDFSRNYRTGQQALSARGTQTVVDNLARIRARDPFMSEVWDAQKAYLTERIGKTDSAAAADQAMLGQGAEAAAFRDEILSRLANSPAVAQIRADIERRKSAYDETITRGWDNSPPAVKAMIDRYGAAGQEVPSGSGFYGASSVLFLNPTAEMENVINQLKRKIEGTQAFKRGIIKFIPNATIHHTLGNAVKEQAAPVEGPLFRQYVQNIQGALKQVGDFFMYVEGVGIDGHRRKGTLRAYFSDGFGEAEGRVRKDAAGNPRHFSKIDFNFFVVVGALNPVEENELNAVLRDLSQAPVGAKIVNEFHVVHHQDDMLRDNIESIGIKFGAARDAPPAAAESLSPTMAQLHSRKNQPVVFSIADDSQQEYQLLVQDDFVTPPMRVSISGVEQAQAPDVLIQVMTVPEEGGRAYPVGFVSGIKADEDGAMSHRWGIVLDYDGILKDLQSNSFPSQDGRSLITGMANYIVGQGGASREYQQSIKFLWDYFNLVLNIETDEQILAFFAGAPQNLRQGHLLRAMSEFLTSFVPEGGRISLEVAHKRSRAALAAGAPFEDTPLGAYYQRTGYEMVAMQDNAKGTLKVVKLEKKRNTAVAVSWRDVRQLGEYVTKSDQAMLGQGANIILNQKRPSRLEDFADYLARISAIVAQEEQRGSPPETLAAAFAVQENVSPLERDLFTDAFPDVVDFSALQNPEPPPRSRLLSWIAAKIAVPAIIGSSFCVSCSSTAMRDTTVAESQEEDLYVLKIRARDGRTFIGHTHSDPRTADSDADIFMHDEFGDFLSSIDTRQGFKEQFEALIQKDEKQVLLGHKRQELFYLRDLVKRQPVVLGIEADDETARSLVESQELLYPHYVKFLRSRGFKNPEQSAEDIFLIMVGPGLTLSAQGERLKIVGIDGAEELREYTLALFDQIKHLDEEFQNTIADDALMHELFVAPRDITLRYSNEEQERITARIKDPVIRSKMYTLLDRKNQLSEFTHLRDVTMAENIIAHGINVITVGAKHLPGIMKEIEKLEAKDKAKAAESVQSGTPDKAMLGQAKQADRTAAFTKGGIDLNPANLNLQIKRDANGIPLPLRMQNVPAINIQGLFPVIIEITPVNLPLLLGWADELKQPAAGRAGKGNADNPSPQRSLGTVPSSSGRETQKQLPSRDPAQVSSLN